MLLKTYAHSKILESVRWNKFIIFSTFYVVVVVAYYILLSSQSCKQPASLSQTRKHKPEPEKRLEALTRLKKAQ